MEVINFAETPSLVSQYMSELRDVNVQSDMLRFRRNLERIGEIMAYEMSKRMRYKTVDVTTPLAVAPSQVLDEQVVLATIFRAGIPFHKGFLDYFDHAQNAFVSAYRKYREKENFDVFIEYIASPRIDGKTLVIADPMLATGSSMDLCYRALLTKGEPAHVHVASIIASRSHMGRKPVTVTKEFHSKYEPSFTRTVELFTWEKLDAVPAVKEAFGL